MPSALFYILVTYSLSIPYLLPIYFPLFFFHSPRSRRF